MRPFLFSKRHLVYKLSFSAFIIGVELFALGCFYRPWAVFEIARADNSNEVILSVEFGLWEVCQHTPGKSGIATCALPRSVVWLTATQVFQCFAFFFYLLAVVFIVCQNWILEEDSEYQEYRCFELFSLAASILVMASFLLYMVNIKPEVLSLMREFSQKGDDDTHKSSRFILQNDSFSAWCSIVDIVSSYITLTATIFIAYFSEYRVRFS